MGPTEWTVISTGLVIIIANAATFRSLRTEMNSQRSELWSELKNLRKEMTEGFNALRKEMGALRERMAHLEGLRESIDRAGRNAARTWTRWRALSDSMDRICRAYN